MFVLAGAGVLARASQGVVPKLCNIDGEKGSR